MECGTTRENLKNNVLSKRSFSQQREILYDLLYEILYDFISCMIPLT